MESLSDYENDDKENVPPCGKPSKEKEEKKQRTKKIVISSDSEDDGNFENCKRCSKKYSVLILIFLDLKTLREKPTEPAKPERKIPVKKDFVVDDDYISEESSEEESEEEEEDVDDEEYRESSPEVEAKISYSDRKQKKRPTDEEEWFLLSLSEKFSGPM